VTVPEPSTITLAIERPGEPTTTLNLSGGKLLLGRETGDVVLRDAEASAMHAEIDVTGPAVIVRDLGSSNGTWRGRPGSDGAMQWERLPQFALGIGAAFRCGTTVLRLVAMEGATPIAAGRTVVSGKRDEVSSPALQVSSVTLARGSGGPPPASASPTLPGQSSSTVATPVRSEQTVVGPPPPPATAMPARRLDTEPTPSRDDPSSAPPVPASQTMRAPVEAAMAATPAPSHPTQVAPQLGTPSPVADVASAPIAAPVTTPTPPPGASVVGRPPVSNALIRPGGKPITGASSVVPPGAGKKIWLRRIGIAAAAIAVVTAIGFGIAWMVKRFTGGPPELAVAMARELPADAIGFAALASPRAQLELLGDSVPEPVRKQVGDALGFDAFTPAGWETQGIDASGDIGIGVLEATKPTVTVSFGLHDAAKLRTALPEMIAKVTGAAAPTLSDRSYGDVTGLWIESPQPIAVLLRERRAMLVFGLPGTEATVVSGHAERLARIEGNGDGDSLAGRDGFRALDDGVGKPMAFVYLDGVTMRGAIPGAAATLLALRTGFAEIDALSLSLTTDGPRTHLVWETVLREGSTSLRYVADVDRSARALGRVPGPALGAMDGAVAITPIVETVRAFASLAGVWGTVETEFREHTNLEIGSDVLDNLGGEFGAVLMRLPSKKGATDFALAAYASVKDAKKAAASLDKAIPALQSKLFDAPPVTESTGDVAVHTFAFPAIDEEMKLSVFVAADHVWFTLGKVDNRPIIEGSGKAIGVDARHAAIREAVSKGDSFSGFVDVRELMTALDPLWSDSERKDVTAAAPVFAPMEVVTWRVRTKDRRSTATLTLHTSADDGLATIVRATMKVAGETFAASVARTRKAAECEALIAKLEALAVSDTSRTVGDYALRFEVREACEGRATSEQITCALAAKTFSDVDACGGADAGLLPAEPEPQAVPYVEDIWPNTRSSPGDGSVPRPEINYGVDVGTDPQIRGRGDALVTIVEFGDFQCPYCREVTSTIDDLLTRHGDDVRVVFRHNPLAIHPEAKAAAKAALAAARQGKFWAMHDKLFDQQYELAANKYREYAIAVGLDVTKFDADLADPALDRRLEEEMATAKRFGVTGTPAFFVNGRFLSGNQPAAVFDRVIAEELARARTFVERRGNTRKRLYEDMISRWATEVGRSTATALPPDSGERFDVDTTGMPQRGASGFARVKLIECGDFECPYCQRATKTMDRILADYPTQVTMFFAHNPLSFHPAAEPAARAAVAAERQGKFWEMHDKLFADAESLDEATFVLYARELKLDVDKFKADFASADVAKKVADDKKLCVDKGGSSTPTFFLNGRRIEGAHAYETFKALIDAELIGGI
jgi:protein-disulfide isomerase